MGKLHNSFFIVSIKTLKWTHDTETCHNLSEENLTTYNVTAEIVFKLRLFIRQADNGNGATPASLPTPIKCKDR